MITAIPDKNNQSSPAERIQMNILLIDSNPEAARKVSKEVRTVLTDE